MTLSMLDWIASYFTNGVDAAAASIAVDANKHVTLYIACNYGPPSPENILKAGKLVDAIRKLVAPSRSEPNSVANRAGYYTIRELVVDTCWATVWKKIVAVQTILRGENAMAHFDSIIESWLNFCHKEQRIANGSHLLNNICKETGKELPLVLKSLLEDLRNIKEETPTQNNEWKINAFTASGHSCEVLLHSDMIMSVLNYSDRCELSQNIGDDSSDSSASSEGDAEEQPDPLWVFSLRAEEFKLIQRFVNAAQELYQYHLGALILGMYGAKLFRRFWGSDVMVKPFSELFSIAWVHVEYTLPASISLTFNKSPIEWATSAFNTSVDNSKKLSLEEHNIIEPHCRDLWGKGKLESGKVHEEMAMALFIIKNRKDVYHRAVGISAPPCYTCGLFYKYLDTKLRFRKMSHIIITDWILPPVTDEEVLGALRLVSLRLQGSLRNVIIDFLMDSKRKEQGHHITETPKIVSTVASFIRT